MHVSVRRTLTIYGCSLAVDPWIMTSHLWIPGWSFHSLLDTYTKHTLSLSLRTARLYHTLLTSMKSVSTHTWAQWAFCSLLHTSQTFLSSSQTHLNSWKISHCTVLCVVQEQKTKFPSFYVLFLTQSCTIFSYQLLYADTYTMTGSPSTGSEGLMKVRGHRHFLHFLLIMTCLRHLMPCWLLPPDI